MNPGSEPTVELISSPSLNDSNKTDTVDASGDDVNNALGGTSKTSVPYDTETTLKLLSSVFETLFTTSNLSKNSYLQSHMNSEMYLPIYVVASLPEVREITTKPSLIYEGLKGCEQVTVVLNKSLNINSTESIAQKAQDEKSTNPQNKEDSETDSKYLNAMVKPLVRLQRTTIILRNVSSSTPADEVTALFTETPNCPKPLSTRADIGDCWFVTFENEDTTLDAFEIIRLKSFQGKPIAARIKSETLQRSFYFPHMKPGAVPHYAFNAGYNAEVMGYVPFNNGGAILSNPPQTPISTNAYYGIQVPVVQRWNNQQKPDDGDTTSAAAINEEGDDSRKSQGLLPTSSAMTYNPMSVTVNPGYGIWDMMPMQTHGYNSTTQGVYDGKDTKRNRNTDVRGRRAKDFSVPTGNRGKLSQAGNQRDGSGDSGGPGKRRRNIKNKKGNIETEKQKVSVDKTGGMVQLGIANFPPLPTTTECGYQTDFQKFTREQFVSIFNNVSNSSEWSTIPASLKQVVDGCPVILTQQVPNLEINSNSHCEFIPETIVPKPNTTWSGSASKAVKAPPQKPIPLISPKKPATLAKAQKEEPKKETSSNAHLPRNRRNRKPQDRDGKKKIDTNSDNSGKGGGNKGSKENNVAPTSKPNNTQNQSSNNNLGPTWSQIARSKRSSAHTKIDSSLQQAS